MQKRRKQDRRTQLEAGVACGLLYAALAACAPTQAPPATEAEKMAAQEDYVSCLKKGALSIDDGRADVSSIASEILPLCSAQFSRYQETFGRGLKPEARQAFEAKLLEYERSTAETAVIQERADKAARSGRSGS